MSMKNLILNCSLRKRKQKMNYNQLYFSYIGMRIPHPPKKNKQTVILCLLSNAGKRYARRLLFATGKALGM